MPKKIVFQLNKILKKLRKEDAKLQYDITKKVFSDTKLFVEIESIEKDLFDKITYLYHYGFLTDKDKIEVLKLMDGLNNQLKNASFEGTQFIIKQLEEWISHEMEYIDYEPGAKGREYIRLLDLIRSKNYKLIVDKAELEYRSGRVIYDGAVIQGLKINKGIFSTNVELTAEHYASKEAIMDIYHDRAISSSKNKLINIGLDPYCYLAEPGKLNNKGMHSIRKILGARYAEGCLTVKIVTNINRVWLRVERGVPAKFAIEAKKIPIKAPKKNKGYRVRIGNETKYLVA